MNRGLGKGIDKILPIGVDLNKVLGGMHIRNIDITMITANPDQPRKVISEQRLAELTSSIRVHGILQPIIVVPGGNNKFMIVAGERRWRAAKSVGLKTIPCVVQTLDNLKQLQISLIENIQRQGLNLMEQAVSVQRLRDDFNQSYEEIAKSIGKSYSAVANLVRLVRLPTDMQHSLSEGLISEGHARSLLALEKYQAAQAKLHQLILDDHWSVRRSEQYAREVKITGLSSNQSSNARSSRFVESDWTRRLSSKLNSNVTLSPMSKGGYIRINYRNDQDLDRLQKKLG